MKQEVLHDNLLKAIREKLPYEENLASVLGNLLWRQPKFLKR